MKALVSLAVVLAIYRYSKRRHYFTGEVAAKAPRAHAEETVIEHAEQGGLLPKEIVASRPFCKDCSAYIESHGGQIVTQDRAVFDE
jgi:hypothetical protein